MHELSIAQRIVEIASHTAVAAGAVRVLRVCVRIGQMACVHETALRFSFQELTHEGLLQGCVLDVVHVPLAVFCPQCRKSAETGRSLTLRCPACDSPCQEISTGLELDVDEIEVEYDDTATTSEHVQHEHEYQAADSGGSHQNP